MNRRFTVFSVILVVQDITTGNWEFITLTYIYITSHMYYIITYARFMIWLCMHVYILHCNI
jgi:hypothetical protein